MALLLNTKLRTFCLIILLGLDFGLTQETCSSTCSSNGVCQKYEDENELCCKCNAGFNGNGINCFEKDYPLTIRGTIKGRLNGVELKEMEVHVYAHTEATDARNHIAIGSIPSELGNKLTLVMPFASSIHWLFAGDVNHNALNGLSLTGGIFRRLSESTYLNDQGSIIGNLHVKQNFTGVFENSKELQFETVLEGNLPDFAQDEQVIYPDYNQDYQYSTDIENANDERLIEARGSIEYRLSTIRNQDVFKNFRIEHNEKIHFTICDGLINEKLKTSSALTKMSTKRLQVTYSKGEEQVRFSSANFLKSLSDQTINPCDLNECSVYAECIVDPQAESGQEYYCQCKPGFEGDGNECTDVNECEEGTAYCSPFAQCNNLLGHYECQCLPPRIGDGRNCANDDSSSSNNYEICSRCSENARCATDESGNLYCKCNDGYVGNGVDCQLVDVNDSDQAYETSTTSTASTTLSTPQRFLHTNKCERCHPDATCEIKVENGGECCVCLDGFVGNGKYCFAEATPILLTGKVTGTLNDLKLDDLDFYSYVLTHSSDSRNFVAIGKIPQNLGGSFQTLISIVNPVNWLFAGINGGNSDNKVPNGFQLTGGLFSRITTLTYFDELGRQSHSVRLRQQFLGLNSDTENKEITVVTELDGSLPNLDPDAQVVFRDYKQEYNHYAKGSVRSSGEISYEVTTTKNSRQFTSYKIYYSDEISFSECPHAISREPDVVRISSKRVYIRYTKGDSLVRFSSANFIHTQDASDDPCELNSCSIYAECVTDLDAPNNYTCICKAGFEGDGFNCDDLDECQAGEADCDPNAVCYNLVGHYECRCKSPYKGNGKECNYDLDCRSCDSNAKCIDNDGQKSCVCNDGYYGDGFRCSADTPGSCICGENAYCTTNYLNRRPECRCKEGFSGDPKKYCKPLPCNELFNCNQNAKCELDSKGSYACKCLSGFYGDGFICTTQTCDVLNNCGANAKCDPDPLTLQFRCVCDYGFIGNGYDCSKDTQSCNVLKNCHPNAECLLEDRTNRHFCKCKPGYSGDGYQCAAINSCRNRSPQICDINADCVFDTKVNDYICKCKSGFEGNGLRSKCFIDESYGLYLVYAQGSSLFKLPFKSNEEDNILVHKNRIVYIPGQTAIGVSYDCHEKFIYWSDVSGKSLNRIREDGSNYSVVLNNVKSAEGLAVDWISRNIYFTDSESRTIEVASLNGLYRKVIIKSHLSNPRGIAIDPIDGYIFWTDWNRKNPKIERANMDGTHRKIIVHEDLGVPNGLYFDQKRQEVCWGDAKTKKIECVEKDGSNRRIVAKISQIYPFDLTEVRSNIYWSDWSKKEIQNVDKDGVVGQPLKLSPGGNGRVYGIVAVKNSCPKGTNACDRTNGDCSQLCLPRPDHTRQCACSDESNSECLKTLLNN